MTTSITLRRVSLAKCSGIWREFRERTMKFLYDGKCRKPLILQGFWGNKRNSYARVFKTAALWPLRYASVYSIGTEYIVPHFWKNVKMKISRIVSGRKIMFISLSCFRWWTESISVFLGGETESSPKVRKICTVRCVLGRLERLGLQKFPKH